VASSKENKVLILIVDRDNDIGVKTNIESPIIGREENLKVATQLAIADPEEADANTIFAAIKMFDELKTKYGENIEIASVTGLPEEGLEADRKIVNELSKVLEKFPANSCIFVSDGVTDQEVIPIISSKIPIMHVKRIVIRHSESVEETWALLSRYLRKAVFEQKYSRILLGIPGILLLIIGLLMLSGLGYLIFPVLIALAGLLMFIRGFNIDSTIEEFY
jgi:putative membrane protein